MRRRSRLGACKPFRPTLERSNSELPHVRSDVSEYRKASNFKLTRLLVNRFYQPDERIYGRLSAGISEENVQRRRRPGAIPGPRRRLIG